MDLTHGDEVDEPTDMDVVLPVDCTSFPFPPGAGFPFGLRGEITPGGGCNLVANVRGG